MLADAVLENFEDSLLNFDSNFVSSTPELLDGLKEMLAALRHPLEAGGKRVRPKICLLMAQAIGSQPALDNALKAAKAIELVHTYSLVHDDLPCMDNDDTRRGRPTVHKVYGDAKALLVGDALLTESFLWLARLQTLHQPHIASLSVSILSGAAGYRGMIGGQWLDVSLDGRQIDVASTNRQPKNIHYESLKAIHLLKTGCLIAAATELGTLCGLNEREMSTQSSAQLRELAKTMGKDLGVAFQLTDDTLDTTSSSQELGKTAGKDVAQKKQTAVSILGLEQAKIEAARYTEEAKQKMILLFERISAKDESAENARTQLLALVSALARRAN